MNLRLGARMLILLSAITLASCSTIATVPQLQCLPPLDLPTISPEELEPLSDGTYRKLVIRDKLRAEREITYCNMIRALDGTPS